MCQKVVGFDSQNANLLLQGVEPKKESDGSYSDEFSEHIVDEDKGSLKDNNSKKSSMNYEDASF